MSREVLNILHNLAEKVEACRFAPPVTHVYNPLQYARAPLEQYVCRYACGKKEILLLGMNPGPFGMAQTGVPFGDVRMVRDWLGIEAPVDRPPREHPKRPVFGFECTRSEVSGSRLWGWARDAFGTPEAFFQRFYVHNYCPLVFMEESGRNLTPDKLKAAERKPLFEACDEALLRLAGQMQPDYAIGIGAFAEKCLQRVLDEHAACIGRIPHPSPASPLANRGWAEAANKALLDCGVKL